MIINLRKNIKYMVHGFLTILVCLSIVSYSAGARADGDMQATRSATGDVVSPSGTVPYDLKNLSSIDASKIVKSTSILGSGVIDLSALGGGTGGSGILAKLSGFFDKLIPILKNVFLSTLLGGLDSKGGISGLISQFGGLQQGLKGLSGGSCSGGQSITGGLFNFAQNMIAQKVSQSGVGSVGSDLKSQVCKAVGNTSGGTGTVSSIDTDSKGGKKIAECAQKSIGNSTADVASTQGGALGCALAVSRMLDCAGYGVGTHVSTVALYNALDKDKCYKKVDTGHITGADAMKLQPGDVLVTKRGSRAGHTGIYEGNGNIISNSSSGFQGSAKGTIQRNYTVKKWSGVTGRNPGGSAVFRRVCE